MAENNMNVKIKNHGVIPKEEEQATPEELYARLIEKIKNYHPSADDLKMIDKAYNFAKKSHGDQKRKSGEPYIIHPLHTALILADLELDKESIMAGLLHDVMEDTAATREIMIREFGEEVTDLVDGVTKLTKLDYDVDKVEEQAENLRRRKEGLPEINYEQQREQKAQNAKKGKYSFTLGILSAIGCFIMPIVADILAVLGIIFGVKGIKTSNKRKAQIGIVLCVLVLIWNVVNIALG